MIEIVRRNIRSNRNFFSKIPEQRTLNKESLRLRFVQSDHSYPAAIEALRGLHYQLPPFAQDKLVRVIRGSILDVAVDIRKSSPTFGKWVSLEVSAEKWNQILIPKGFAHGFVTLCENTEVIYKVTEYYSPAHDRSIRFDDPEIGVHWPIPASDLQMSDKDAKAPLLSDAELFD